MTRRIFNVCSFGAKGDGVGDDSTAIQAAFDAAVTAKGCLFFPPGTFKITRAITGRGLRVPVAVRGEGPNVSVLAVHAGADGLDLEFEQEGATQPWGLHLADLGFEAIGRAGTALVVSYGQPETTSEHYRPSTVVRNVVIASNHRGSWSNGLRVRSAWNLFLTDVSISGDSAGGNWNAMSGIGIQLERMCVNAHFTNVRCNFWATGFYYHAGIGGNTEGLFFTNCSMVAVKRGVWITGNPSPPAPRVSTLTWTGGMIECRVGGVDTGSAAFHLMHVWTALINGAQLIAETLPATHTTYALFLDNCAGVVLAGCDVNAWHFGLFTTGTCSAINSHGNTYTNCAIQNAFNEGTLASRSYGHVYFNNAPNDLDPAGVNKLGFAG